MRVYGQIIAACWIAFFGVWIVLSIAGVRGNRTYSPSSSALRLLLVVAAALAIRYSDRLPASTFAYVTANVAAAGCALCIIGVAFAIWARVTLGRNWGMPMTLHERAELVTSGPYAFVRHPIYTGILAMFIGTSLVYPPVAVPSVIMLGYILFSARREERDMQRQFPDAYPAYKKRSKMLVPFVL
jgi:protein-S-isoprenylcysteine O-methyltransferase Ste14